MSSDCGNVQKVFVPTDAEKEPETEVINGVRITDLAAEKIIAFCEKDGKSSEEYGLYVKVVTDGCSGKSYVMDLANIGDLVKEDAKLFTHNNATIIVDKLSYIFVIGSELDYVETLLMSGFQLVNPNIKKTCSCGSSFAVQSDFKVYLSV